MMMMIMMQTMRMMMIGMIWMMMMMIQTIRMMMMMIWFQWCIKFHEKTIEGFIEASISGGF